MRVGGVLKTSHRDEYLVDHAADMFVTDPPDALQLTRDLDIESDLLTTRPVETAAWIGRGKQILPVPNGFSLMLPSDELAVRESRLFSDAGRDRLLAEINQPSRENDDDESLESFAVRRFGHEAFDRLIQPLVSGIYTADPARLSMRATMQRFVAMERQHGSLMAAARSRRGARSDSSASGARYHLFRAPRLGIGALVDAIAASLGSVDVRTGTAD